MKRGEQWPVPSTIAGVGIGLRTPHIPEVLDTTPAIPWFELLADNWLAAGGLSLDYLHAVSERYPLTLHGVGLSLGGSDPLDLGYLANIKWLKERCGAVWYSEHLCFSQFRRHHYHDLCPLPFTNEAVRHVIERIRKVQDFLGEQILIENVSSYLRYRESQFGEGEFLARVAEGADCLLLVDLNNLYVNQINHGQDARRIIDCLPAQRVREIHLAGYQEKAGFLLDAHNHPVAEPVWWLYNYALRRWGQVATLIEWDHDLPPWTVLIGEQRQATDYHASTLCKHSSGALEAELRAELEAEQS